MKKLLCLLLIITLLIPLVPIPTNALQIKFSDIDDNYWGKSSIDYVSAKGYMVGYGEKFGILDNVTEGQYLAVLCRIFGYDGLHPLDSEAPARKLGLLKDGETVNLTANLNRAGIATYTIRAYEYLNPKATYPEELEAYKAFITDYASLSADLKQTALKCVEKGLLAGGPDGKFNPSDFTTRAQAAAFIHRILEQSERDKVAPIFAEPDKEFEAFANSEEAVKYLSMGSGIPLYKVADGKIIFNDPREGVRLVTNRFNKEANKELYELVRDWTMYAKQHGHHVRVTLYPGSTAAVVRYYDSEFYGKNNPDKFGTNLYLRIELTPSKWRQEQKEYTNYGWYIAMLVTDDTKDWAKVNYREPVITKALEIGVKSIYGDSLGKKMFDYMISEFDKDMDAWFNHNRTNYENTEYGYRQDLGGLEVVNANGLGTQSVYVLTNKK